MKGDCQSFLVFCMLLRLEDARIIGVGWDTLHQRFSLAINEEDLDEWDNS